MFCTKDLVADYAPSRGPCNSCCPLASSYLGYALVQSLVTKPVVCELEVNVYKDLEAILNQSCASRLLFVLHFCAT